MASENWPELANSLVSELRGARGRIALLVGPDARPILSSWAQLMGEEVVSVGRQLTENGNPLPEIPKALAASVFLADLDILFWPTLSLNPVQLLRVLARSDPRIAVWPGAINFRRATYSLPGRPDHFEELLRDAVVLRTRSVNFPDEIPFSIERIPA